MNSIQSVSQQLPALPAPIWATIFSYCSVDHLVSKVVVLNKYFCDLITQNPDVKRMVWQPYAHSRKYTALQGKEVDFTAIREAVKGLLQAAKPINKQALYFFEFELGSIATEFDQRLDAKNKTFIEAEKLVRTIFQKATSFEKSEVQNLEAFHKLFEDYEKPIPPVTSEKFVRKEEAFKAIGEYCAKVARRKPVDLATVVLVYLDLKQKVTDKDLEFARSNFYAECLITKLEAKRME